MTERGDRSKLPPGPWSWEDNGLAGRPLGHGHVYLLDRNGRKIAAIWGRPEEKIAIADFIVEARDAAVPGAHDVLLEVYERLGPRADGGRIVGAADYAALSAEEIDGKWDFDDRHLMHRVARVLAGGSTP